MRVIEVSEKTLPQIRTVFQSLREIVYDKVRNSPPPFSSPIKGEETVWYSSIPFLVRPRGSGQDSPLPRLRGMGGEKGEGDRKNVTTQIPHIE